MEKGDIITVDNKKYVLKNKEDGCKGCCLDKSGKCILVPCSFGDCLRPLKEGDKE